MSQKDRIYIIVFSVLVHILLFLIWEGANFLNLFDSDPIPEQVLAEPLVFDLRSENKPKRVIETPKNNEKIKPEKAKLLSDKDSIAKNQNIEKEVKVDEAYSKGDYESYEIPKPQGMIVPPPEKSIKPDKKKIKKDLKDYLPKHNIEELLKEQEKKYKPPLKQGISKIRKLVLHDNTLSKSLERGGLSFNTYNWEFAPYLLMLKAKIQSNIFPPLAFSRLGIISGITMVKFRIYPDGKMERLEVLGYNGHRSLMETSYNAIKISAPFPTLPDNFPEDYLEITGKFVYIISGKK